LDRKVFSGASIPSAIFNTKMVQPATTWQALQPSPRAPPQQASGFASPALLIYTEKSSVAPLPRKSF
jgi:hypothetical protein